MKLKIEKTKYGYRAELDDLPGSPPCGDAKTKADAVYVLFYNLIRFEYLQRRFKIDLSVIEKIDNGKKSLINLNVLGKRS